MFFLGIDSNVHRTVVAALDLEAASIVAEGSSDHQLLSGVPTGAREQDPAGWISALGFGGAAVFGTIGAGS